jgi:hypothetical protein
MISRRTFLAALGSAILVPTVLIEEELLLPEKTFFLPPKQGWIVAPGSGTTLLTISYYSNQALKILENTIILSSRMEDHIGPNRRYGKVAISNRYALRYSDDKEPWLSQRRSR